MGKKGIGGFDSLIDLAGKFVERQKGIWDHDAWVDFLAEMQKNGFKLNDDMKSYLGLVLESMKKVYDSGMITKGMENVVSDMSSNAVKFIQKTSGAWDQSGWEAFLKDFQKKGVDLTDETRSYLGGVLEAVKALYAVLPPSGPKKSASK